MSASSALASPGVARDDPAAALDVVGTDEREVGRDPRDRDVGRIGEEGVSPLEREVGDQRHPRPPERGPLRIVGLDPPQVWIGRERVDPDVDDRLEVGSHRVSKAHRPCF